MKTKSKNRKQYKYIICYSGQKTGKSIKLLQNFLSISWASCDSHTNRRGLMSPVWLYICFSFHHGLFKWDEACLFDFPCRRCSSSVCACLALVRIPWCWSTPARRTPSRPSTYCWVSRRTVGWQHEPTSTAAPTGDSVAFCFGKATQRWCPWVSLHFRGEKKELSDVFVFLSAASCAGVLQWRVGIASPCFSSRTGRMFVFSRPRHRSCWWGHLAKDVDFCGGASCDLCLLLSAVQSVCNPRRGVLYGVRGAEGALCLHPWPIYTRQVC